MGQQDRVEVSLTITAGRGARSERKATDGSRPNPISTQATAAPRTCRRTSPVCATSLDQPCTPEFAYGEEGRDHAEAEHRRSDQPVAVREVHVPDPEEDRRDHPEWEGKQQQPPPPPSHEPSMPPAPGDGDPGAAGRGRQP